MKSTDTESTDNRPRFFENRPMIIYSIRTVPRYLAAALGEKSSSALLNSPNEVAQPESQPESLEQRMLALLANGPLAKAAISVRLGQKEISGHLNQVIRVLLANQTLEYTVPDRPTSRLQQYRLTEKGQALLATLRQGKTRP